MASQQAKLPSKRVTEARAAAQRAKLDAQAQRRREAAEQQATEQPAKGIQGKQKQASLLAKKRASTTIERAIADYLLDHDDTAGKLLRPALPELVRMERTKQLVLHTISRTGARE